MFKILEKNVLNRYVSHMILEVPLAAKNAKPGQFVIIRVDQFGERIPLTVFKSDAQRGTVEIIYQKVGTTTYKLDEKQAGDYISDVVGPLGKPSQLSGYDKAAVVSGGVGTAIAYPLAEGLYKNGCDVDVILGFRNKELVILDDEMRKVSKKVSVVTDDGSNGSKGLVTDVLRENLAMGKKYDVVIAVGPVPMMKAVCGITRKNNIKSIASMTAIMIDGTGMCGGCRLTVGEKSCFACVDGPDFDGDKIDFDEAINRSRVFKVQEDASREKFCNLFKEV